MRKETTHTLTVEGRGEFPLDMLRYDACWPMTQRDVAAMGAADYTGEPRQVTVTRLSHRLYLFTTNRWRSFGWKPVSHKRDGEEMGVI